MKRITKKEKTVHKAPLKRGRGNPVKKSVVFLVVLICLVFAAREFIVSAVSRVEPLSRREAVETALLEGILIKEEKVVKSPANGKLQCLAEDGERLEVGAPAAQVFSYGQESGEEESYKISTPYAGIFCIHVDSLESVLTPGNLDVLELSKLEKIGSGTIPEGRVSKGQPAFKIIDNLAPLYFYTQIPKKACPRNLTEESVWMQAAWENLPLMMRPLRVWDRGNNWDCIFQLSEYPEAIIHCRGVQVKAAVGRISGLIVPRKAIVYRGGEPGIFTVNKKKALWVPVQIEGELAEEAAVSGPGLSENTRYVINPVLIRDKWPVE